MAEEVTFYRFLSEVRAFLAKLVKDPIKAEPSKYLKDRDFTRSKLIKDLMARDVLERHEKILDSTNSEEKTAKYVVKFKVRKKDFENKIHKIYIKYFEKNLPEKKEKENVQESVFKNEEDMKQAILKNPKDREAYETRGGMKIDECEGGECALGGTSCDGVASETSNGYLGFNAPLSRQIINRGMPTRKKDKKNKPENILGKTITAEGKSVKRIIITEEQYDMIMNETALGDAGAVGDYTANGLVLKTSDGKEDPCAKAGKVKVKMVMDK